MKILFGIDVSENKKNTQETVHEALVVEKTTPALRESLQKSAEIISEQERHIALPRWMRVLKFITFFLWFVLGAGIVNALADGTPLREGFKNAPAIFIIFPIIFLGWLSLYLYERQRKQSANENTTYKEHQDQALKIAEHIYDELGVPGHAFKMDIFSFRYKMVDGKLKRLGTSVANFMNMEKRVFIEDDRFHIADTEKHLAFDIDAIKYIEMVKRRGMVIYWNKDIAYNKGIYKPYKIRVNQMGVLFMDYGIMHIDMDGESYQLYLPKYEIDQLKSLVDIKIK